MAGRAALDAERFDRDGHATDDGWLSDASGRGMEGEIDGGQGGERPGATGNAPSNPIEPGGALPASLISGEWAGQANWTGKQTLTPPAAFEQTFEFQTDVTLSMADDGRPLNLALPFGGYARRIRDAVQLVGEAGGGGWIT